MVPLRFDSPECFGTVKAFLDDSGYTEQACCERLGLGAQHEILTRRPSEPAPEIRDAADLLMSLFLLGARIEEKRVRELLPAEVVDSLAKIGLLVIDTAGACHAPVCLYAVRQLYIASDRWSNPDGSHFTPPRTSSTPRSRRTPTGSCGCCRRSPASGFWTSVRGAASPRSKRLPRTREERGPWTSPGDPRPSRNSIAGSTVSTTRPSSRATSLSRWQVCGSIGLWPILPTSRRAPRSGSFRTRER